MRGFKLLRGYSKETFLSPGIYTTTTASNVYNNTNSSSFKTSCYINENNDMLVNFLYHPVRRLEYINVNLFAEKSENIRNLGNS